MRDSLTSEVKSRVLRNHAPSTLKAAPIRPGQAVTETEIFSTQVVDRCCLWMAAEIRLPKQICPRSDNAAGPSAKALSKGFRSKEYGSQPRWLLKVTSARKPLSEFASIFTSQQKTVMRFRALMVWPQLSGGRRNPAAPCVLPPKGCLRQGKHPPHRRIFQRSRDRYVVVNIPASSRNVNETGCFRATTQRGSGHRGQRRG